MIIPNSITVFRDQEGRFVIWSGSLGDVIVRRNEIVLMMKGVDEIHYPLCALTLRASIKAIE